MKNKLLISFCCLSASVFGQVGGQTSYQFLKLPVSARMTALGGSLLSLQDDDVNLAAQNPAALNALMNGNIVFNQSFLPSGVKSGYFAYGHHVDKWKATLHGGVEYVSYGEFKRTDETGTQIGTFKAGEWGITTGIGRMLSDRTSVGANLHFVGSRLENYNSFGMAADLAAMYSDTAKRLAATVVVRNIGFQFTPYNDKRESVPTNLEMSISKRLKHLPLRFIFTGHHLTQWNIRYDDPNAVQETSIFGEEAPKEKPFVNGVDNFFRHFIVATELSAGKRENFRLRFGYNHLRRAEMKISGGTAGMAGFSLGIGLKIKQFRLDYGWGAYHKAGGLHSITFSTHIREFK